MRLAAAVLTVLLLAGCTAEQWKKTETGATTVEKKAKQGAAVVEALPLPPEVKAPAQGLFKGIAAIAAAVAAFAAWRKRVADAKREKAENGFDAVSEAIDATSNNVELKKALAFSAESYLGSKGALKTLHHESIVRRG